MIITQIFRVVRTYLFLLFVAVLFLGEANGQVAEMNWELDYQIYLKMANDSNHTYDIREVFHITDVQNTNFSSEFVFYPVNPGEKYSKKMQERILDEESYQTLWSALHAKLGGGWIHFTNCIAYALEMQKLNLHEPILKRPETSWKPKPVTESWKRTRNWTFYIPLEQKYAIKEYKARKIENSLGDIRNIPDTYIDLFLTTSAKDYQAMRDKGLYNQLAKIDLVKVLLGANYLGKSQINYISNAVLNAIKGYSSSMLPSVLIFDEFDAAAAMTLDSEGYQVESIVFRASANLSEAEMQGRQGEIIEIIDSINKYNRMAFKKRLSNYYKE